MPRQIASCGKGRWGSNVLPTEWAERLLAVPTPARYAVARIVWWEFFSMRLVPARWAEIDDLIAQRDEVADDALIDALVMVGAPREWAEKRIIVRPRARRKVDGRWV